MAKKIFKKINILIERAAVIIAAHPYVAVAVLTAAVYLSALAKCWIIPFGDGTLLTFDGNDQLAGFYGYLAELPQNRQGLFYSFSNVLGGNMYTLAAYYLMSPFNLLFLLFDHSTIPLAVTIITGLKIVCMSLAFCLALGIIGNAGDLFLYNWGRIIFSLSYAFIGYTISYFMILSWMDALILLPLIFAGLFLLVKRGAGTLYIITLGLGIISNYYIGFMLCLGCCIFYPGIMAYISDDNRALAKCFRKTILRFIGGSILAGGIAAIVLVPVAKALPGHRLISLDEMIYSAEQNFDLSLVFTKLLTATTDGEEVKNGLPMIFVGIFAITFFVLFFFNRAISTRKKTVVLSTALIFLLSFYNSGINLAWHGFTYNFCYNYRYSFLLCFIFLLVGFFSFVRQEELEKKSIERAALLILAIAILSLKSSLENINVWMVTLDGLFIIVILLVMRKGKVVGSRVLFFVLITVVNLYVNTFITLENVQADLTTAGESEYIDYYSSAKEALSEIPGTGFFRYEKAERRTSNDNMLLGIPGVSNFTSTCDGELLSFVASLGYRMAGNSALYETDAPHAADSLLGIKYLLSEQYATENSYDIDDDPPNIVTAEESTDPEELIAEELVDPEEIKDKQSFVTMSDRAYNRVLQMNDYGIYENENALPLMMISDDLMEGEWGINPFEDLNAYYRSLCREMGKDIFRYRNLESLRRISDSERCFSGTFYATRGDWNYLYLPYGDYEITMYVDGDIRNVEYSDEKLVYNLGSFPENSQIELEIWNRNEGAIDKDSIVIYTENMDSLKAYADMIKSRETAIQRISGSRLSGSVNADSDAHIVTTIPFSEGWTVRADGEVLDKRIAFGQFLAFDVVGGYHNISISYIPPGLMLGAVISVLCLLAGVLFGGRAEG